MGKRILSFLLALVMTVGLIPASVFTAAAVETIAGAENSEKSNIFASVTSDIAIDGNLSENSWLTYGKMTSVDTSESKNFGVMWSEGRIYFGFENTDEVTVKVNGASVTPVSNKAANGRELAVAVDKTVTFAGETVDVELSSGSYSWAGTVTLDMADRSYVYQFANGTNGSKSSGNAGGIANGDTIRFYNKYDAATATGEEGKKQNTNNAARVYSVKTELAQLAEDNKTYVFEFDFDATNIPAYYENPDYVGEYYGAYGLCFGFNTTTRAHGFSIGIGNAKNTGLYIMYTSSSSDYKVFKIGKENGSKFHVRLEYTPEGKLTIYVDDHQVGVVENARCASWGSSSAKRMINMNLYSGAVLHPTEDLKNDMEFEVANFRISSYFPEEVVASLAYTGSSGNFTPASIPTVDGVATDDIWSRYYALSADSDSTVTGKVSAAWRSGILYLSTLHQGATEMTLRLGDNAWSLDLTKETVASADGAVSGVNKSGTLELAIDLVKAGVTVDQYNTAVPFNVVLSNGAEHASLKGKCNVVFSDLKSLYIWSYSTGGAAPAYPDKTNAKKYDYTYNFKNDTPSNTTYGCFQWGSNNSNSRPEVVHAKNIYWEQTLTIRKMQTSDGGFGDNEVHKGKGFTYIIADSETQQRAIILLYNKNGMLTLKVGNQVTGSWAYTEVSTGITVDNVNPVTFQLGYQWKADNTLEIYINNTLIATVEKAYTSYTATYKTHSMYTYGVEIDMDVDDFRFISYYAVTDPTYTTAAVLQQGSVATDAVGSPLPTSFETGDFKVPVTWTCSNPAIVAVDGTVTNKSPYPVTVDVSAVIGDQTLEAVPVTVLSTAEKAAYNAFVGEKITIDGDLQETVWLPKETLSGGQPFDILWDGAKLYFAVVAGAEDTDLTVKIGENEIATAQKVAGASAIELKVPYMTEGVTTLQDVSLIVGDSYWYGDVTLVNTIRTDKYTNSNMSKDIKAGHVGTITATADGKGFTFDMPARTETASVVNTQTIYKFDNAAYENRAQDIALELDFSAVAMPVVPLGSVGVDNNVWAGMEFILSDNSGTALRFGLANAGDTGNAAQSGLFLNIGKNTYDSSKDKLGISIPARIWLHKSVEDGMFNLKLVWTSNDTLQVYVDGELVGSASGITTSDELMNKGNYPANGVLNIRATRYDYARTDAPTDTYTMPLNVTISNICYTTETTVEYSETEKQEYNALVAGKMDLDGQLAETEWFTEGKLSGGQPFDILWDAHNLYFAVAADEDDALTVKIGGETVLTATKAAGAEAIEAMAAYVTEGVETLENVTLTLGDSTWTGDVNLLKEQRYLVPIADFSVAGSVTKSADGTAATITLAPAAAAVAIERANLYAQDRPFLIERKNTTHVKYTFTAGNIPVIDNHYNANGGVDTVGTSLVSWAGPAFIISDGAGEALYYGIWNTTEYGLILVVHRTGAFVKLGKTQADGAFELELDWTQEDVDTLSVYVDGELKGTATNVTMANDAIGDYKNDNMMSILALRHNGEVHGLYNQKVEYTIADYVLTKPVEVRYQSEYEAFVGTQIELDGRMNETEWRTGATLSKGQPFDILFNANNVYFGVVAAAGDQTMVIEKDGQVIATATMTSGATAFEAKAELLTGGLEKLENITITVGDSVWHGDITLTALGRVYKPDLGGSLVSRGAQYYDENTNYKSLTLNANGDSVTMKHLYTEGGHNAANGRLYAMQIGNGFDLANNRTDDRVIEFDFYAEHLPAYAYGRNIGMTYAAYGFTGLMSDSNKGGIAYGIMKAQEDNKLYMVFAWQTVASDPQAAHKKVKYIALDKEEGQEFSVRLIWTAGNDVSVYVDGEWKGSVEDCLHKASLGANCFGFNLWGPGVALTADGAQDINWTVSNIRIARPVEVPFVFDTDLIDGQINAQFAEKEPTAESVDWSAVKWEHFVDGTGKVAALVYNQKVYLAVSAIGSVSATLGGETKTATANGLTVLTFDAPLVTAYGQEIALNVSLDGVAVWETAGKVTVAAKVVNPAVPLPLTDARSRATVSGNTITFKTTDSTNNSTGAFVLQRKDIDGLADINSDVLFSQDILIKSMSRGEKTGTFDSIVNNHGYTIMLEYADVKKTFSTMVAPADDQGNLAFFPYKNDSIALGKKIGEKFNLSLLFGADGSIQVYVDGVLKGTVANARANEGVYGTGLGGNVCLLFKYQDAVCGAEKPAEIEVSIPTLTKLGSSKDLIPVEEEITQAAIFGNLNLEKVSEDLPLTATFQTAYLGEKTLRWTSSNEAIIATDGTVHPHDTSSKKVTLTVYLEDSETPLWSVEVTVLAGLDVLRALLSETAMVVDGNLTEAAWLDWVNVDGALSGNIAAAWTKGYAYLAVYSKDADTLNLTFNGKNISVNLNTGAVTGLAGVTAARNAKNGVVEIGIPLAAAGFSLTDYNQAAMMTATLVKGESSVVLPIEALNFSGDVAELQAMANFTKSGGPWTLLTNSIGYKGTEPGVVDFVYKTDNNIDHNELFVMSNEFFFKNLPITNGAYEKSSVQANGFYFYYGDENPDTRGGRTIAGCIFTEDGTNLKLRISSGHNQQGHVIDLGKTLGETFRITQYWYPNDDLALYVDGVLIATIKNASLTTSYLGIDVITFRYYSEKVGPEKVDFTLSNWTKPVTKYETVLDELTKNVVFGRVDLDHVQKDLPLVTSFASANFEALTLKWTSSDESVVATNGKITRHDTEAKSSVVTVYFVDADGNEIKLWDVTVTVDPMTVTKQPAPAIIRAPFATPGSITIDNTVDFDENWLLNGWVLNDDQQPVGYFGVQWDQNNLYFLINADVEKVIMQVGDDAITKGALEGSVFEFQFAMDEFTLAKVTEYGKELPFAIYLDEYSYTGTLKLTNVDFWATDNFFAGLPMLSNNYKSIKMGTADEPDENQGAKQLENGWRVYDLYGGEDAANPAGIRTYILFMKMPVYENFADRTEATHIEFDFLAKALPVWEWNEGAKDEINRAFANYGVTFSLSDKADAGKNSNVAVFGIVNTEEGLVLVVNRGKGIEAHEKFVLNKQVGEEFRIGMTWLTNSNLVLTIDGEEIITINDMSKWVNSVGDTSFVVNMIRNKQKPTSEADNMDVYLTNIAFGKAHSTENIIRNLTFDDIRGENETEDEIVSDLILPTYMTNGQLDHQYPVVWTSTDEATINPATGKVTRPERGIKVVTLTATLAYADGTTESKEFTVIVLGVTIDNGNALVALNDTNPFGMGGSVYPNPIFNLDKTNNSIIYAFDEDDENTKVNLVTLTDLDGVSRLNRLSLRLFVSDDNQNFTEIENYKLTNVGANWYLYGFEADARYIKVHYTHRDIDDSNFSNMPGDMIQVSWNESLVIPENAAEIAVPATTLRDQAVAITLPEGIEAEGLRIALNGEILFHYVDDNGTVYVRIADPTTGVLKLWNAKDIELANKENVYEVTYGTTETLPSSGRWVLGMKAGQKFPDGSSLAVDTLYAMGGKTVKKSTDGGYTWTNVGTVNFAEDGLSSGGWGIDSKTGRLFHEFYGTPAFAGSDVANSHCITYVFYSDDGGKTWTKASGLGKIEGDVYSNYVLSYTDLTELAGNDGEGEHVDFVFPMGAQYNNNGAFCGRVAYTTDGGKTWSYSESKITYGNETAFEGGLSEATILEREDGTLVYYARCQSSTVDNFAISYSLDHGVTWLTPGLTSSVYTTNTQALMMTYDFDGFDGNRLTGSPIFMWGGNNVLGGSSYMRMPLNFAVSTNEMDTFRNIQNIFFRTFQDTFTNEADHYITNPSIQQINGDDMYIAYSRLYHKDSVYTVVNNFSDWFTRTKGAYDSFENGDATYEGWIAAKGYAEADKAQASKGQYSMLVKENTQLTRSVPYLQNGRMSIDLYVDANANFLFELQPAYANVEMKCAVVSARVIGTTMTFHDGTFLTLNEGWNTISFELELLENKVSVSANGGAAKNIAVNEQFNGPTPHELGNYITYVTIIASSTLYVDEFFLESYLDAVVEATEEDKTAAEEVIDLIKAALESGDPADISAARNAYEALSQVQKDLVDRNVPSGTTDKVNEEGALINYYDALVEAEKEMNETLPGFSGFLILNETIDLNLIIPEGVETEGNVVSVKFADGSDAPYTIVNTVYGQAIQYRSFSNQMTREITVQVFNGNGVPLTKPLTISVRGYVQKLLPACQNDVEKALMIRMLDYGALAQLYTNPNATDLANSIIDETLRTFINNYDLVKPDAYTSESATTAGVFSANLSLRESVVMNIQIAQDAVGENENLVVKLNGKELTENQYQKTIDNDGKITISYKFHSDKMNQELYVAIVDASGAVRNETSLSIRDYAHKCMDACEATNRTLCAMLVAMLDYGALAQQYAGTATDDLANRYVSAEQRAWLTEYIWPAN